MIMMPWDSFGFFTVLPRAVALTNSEPTEIAKLNPRRIALLISIGDGAVDVAVSPNPAVGVDAGHVLKDKYTLLKLSHCAYGALVSVSWYGWIAVPPAKIMVTEVVLDKDPCQQQIKADQTPLDASPQATKINGSVVNV